MEPYNQTKCLSNKVPKNKQFLQLITYTEHRRSLFFFYFICFFFFAIECTVLQFTAFVLYNGCKLSKHRKKFPPYNGHSCKIIRKKSKKYWHKFKIEYTNITNVGQNSKVPTFFAQIPTWCHSCWTYCFNIIAPYRNYTV